MPDSQRADLALLLSLVADPRELAGQLAPTERRWLRQRQEMLDPNANIWRALGPAGDDAHLALRILADR